MEQMLHRIPSLGDAILDQLINSPETFSPDCKWIMGEAPEVRIENFNLAFIVNTIHNEEPL